MGRFQAVVVLSMVAIAQLAFADAKSAQDATPPSISTPQKKAGGLAALPPPPAGKSTVIGGAIRQIDPVRDQLTLKVFGAKQTMKILYDERTQFYRNGTRTPLRDLRPVAHASVETVLDGTAIFARSIHILSQVPEGECQGQVVNYNSASGELSVSPALSREPIQLRVPPGIPIVRTGQAASVSANASPSDLVKGTLVSVKFQPGNNGRGIASHIAILATPGSTFVFTGNVTFLDLHAHTLVLVDPRDGNSYKISFDPSSFPVSQDLHQGVHVKVTTTFDGSRYVATAIALK